MSVLVPEVSFGLHCPPGTPKFTRRMAIHIADDCMMTVKDTGLSLERAGKVHDGTWDWFKANGGITRKQVDQVRRERRAAQET